VLEDNLVTSEETDNSWFVPINRRENKPQHTKGGNKYLPAVPLRSSRSIREVPHSSKISNRRGGSSPQHVRRHREGRNAPLSSKLVNSSEINADAIVQGKCQLLSSYLRQHYMLTQSFAIAVTLKIIRDV